MTSMVRILCALLCAHLVTVHGKAPAQPNWAGPRFLDKSALITGGDTDIGLATAGAIYLECGRVVLIGANATKVFSSASLIRSLEVPASRCPPGVSPSIESVYGDVTNASFAAAAVKGAVQAFGNLDVFVNIAEFIGTSKQIGDEGIIAELKGQSDPFDANFYGSLNVLSSVIQAMVKAGKGGSIVNVLSTAALVGWEGHPLYAASKGALRSLNHQVAFRYAGRGIRSNVVFVGATNSTMMRNGSTPLDELRRWHESVIPMGKLAEPWQVAGPILFLSSVDAGYVTGTDIVVDGMLGDSGPGLYTRFVQPASRGGFEQQTVI